MHGRTWVADYGLKPHRFFSKTHDHGTYFETSAMTESVVQLVAVFPKVRLKQIDMSGRESM
jgi:hypothetical protein